MNPNKAKLEKWVSQLMYGNPPTVEQQRWWNNYKNKMKQPVPEGGDAYDKSLESNSITD